MNVNAMAGRRFFVAGRRSFFRSMVGAASLLALAPQFPGRLLLVAEESGASPVDAKRMRALADFTMQTMTTPHPVPYGAEIFDTKTGVSLMRALNAVGPDHDPSAHGEVRTIRLACQKLQSAWLRGYTLYTTCEPCPMCMACCLWAGLDRVVYGATIADAARFGHQIMIPAAEVQKRSDMTCVVDGPVERAYCLRLFTNPEMQKAFQRWKSSRG